MSDKHLASEKCQTAARNTKDIFSLEYGIASYLTLSGGCHFMAAAKQGWVQDGVWKASELNVSFPAAVTFRLPSHFCI